MPHDLTIRHTDLTTLPDAVWGETSVEIFNVSNNKLTSISDRIGKLAKVRLIDLGHNQLSKVPDAIGSSPQVRPPGRVRQQAIRDSGQPGQGARPATA